MSKLTTKQKKFIQAYDGNATRAAKLAGYSEKTATIIGHENLRKPNVSEAIQERQTKELNKLIADRKERQEFWTNVLRESEQETRDRLKASELLGRSEADFTEKVEHSGQPYENWTKEQLKARLEELRKKTK